MNLTSTLCVCYLVYILMEKTRLVTTSLVFSALCGTTDGENEVLGHEPRFRCAHRHTKVKT